jgi:hypothetical protein
LAIQKAMIANKHFIFIPVLLNFLTTPLMAQSESDAPSQNNVIQMINEIPEVQRTQTEVQFCFSNEAFKADFSGEFSFNISKLKDQYIEAIDDRADEVCVSPSKIKGPSEELTYLTKKFSTNSEVTLTAVQGKSTPALNPYEQLSKKRKVVLALRGATAGAVGALLSKASTPLFKYASNQKNPGENVNLSTALLIGTVVDYLQRANGETNEEKIFRNDAAAVFVTNLFRFKDQNTYQLGLVMTLTSIPIFDNQIAKIAARVPKEIDFKWAAAMLVPLAYLGSKEKKHALKHEMYDKGIEFATYAVYGSGLSLKYDNPNFGALGGSFLVLADEFNDSLKGSGGNMSARDAFWGVAGSYFGAWMTTKVSKGFVVQLYGKAIFASFQKEFYL